MNEVTQPFKSRVWQWMKRYQVLRWLAVAMLSVILIIVTLGTYEAKTTNVSNLKQRLQVSTEIYDHNNEKAGGIAGQKGTYIEFKDISPNAVDAVLATEDRRFYQEHGFSVRGTLRAAATTLWNKVRGSQTKVGGSTLTQQLAKNAFLTQDQTMKRKLREIFLAVQIEKDYSKDDILAMYMNHAYFGHGAWGIEDASQKYFGIPARDLDQKQAAMLAGMLQSPNGYDPLTYPEPALNRRNQVLQNMVNTGKLDQDEANKLAKEPIGASDHQIEDTNYSYPYYFDAVIDEATRRYNLDEKAVLNDGYQIYTSLDQTDQQNLQQNYANSNLNPIGGDSQAASIVMDARTGGVRAVVGGRGEHVFRGFNRATQMYRSPGSTIKPIVDYGPSLSRGFKYDSKLKNETMSFGTNHYKPQNYGNFTSPSVKMYEALENSYNIPAVWLMDQIGVNDGYQAAERAGLPVVKDDKNLSLAIGGMEKGTSPLQLTQAYTSFANDGQMSEAHFITKIVDASGRVIVDQTKPKRTRLWSKQDADDMTAMMMGVYTHGTGVPANPSGFTVAGKTGTTEVSGQASTTNNATDSWAIAYTPDVVVTTWMGYDKTDADHTIPAQLAESAGPMMKATLEQVLPNTEQTPFEMQSVRAKLAEEEAAKQRTEKDITSDEVNEQLNDIGSKISAGISQAAEDVKRGAKSLWAQIMGN